MATAIVLDRRVSEQLIRERRERGIDQFDEVWGGVYIVSPIANLEHQYVSTAFSRILLVVVHDPGRGRVFAGANVSDRVEGWEHNFRVPDTVVILNDGKARDCGTHLCGGPDFLVEVVSPDDKTYEKLDFYARIGVRELLIVEPESRSAELYRLSGSVMLPVGRSESGNAAVLTSEGVPLNFRWVEVDGQPRIHVSRTDGQPGEWTV